jgi:hypothetical protein
MSDTKTTSQTQPEGTFDPLKLWTAGLETWSRLTRDNVERIQSFYHRSDDEKRDPMAFWNTGADAWTQLACDNIERFQSLYHQVAELEGAAYERARKSAKDIGDMMSDTVTYAADLTRELQKVGLETVRRNARVFRTED